MKYNGIELKEITEPQIFDPPREMLVWDDDSDNLNITKVWGIAPQSAHDSLPVASAESCWTHCAEIPEEPKPRRATNRELSRWLAEGKGEMLTDSDGGKVDTAYYYTFNTDQCAVRDGISVRKWDDLNWHEPTVEYMGLEADK